MTIDTSTYFYLISAYVLVFYFLALIVCLRRLQVSGAPSARRLLFGVLAITGWLVINYLLGSSESFGDFDNRPPPFMIFFFSILITSFALAGSSLGTLLAKGLKYEELIGFQSFRIFVEIALLIAAKEGLAPQALTLHGWNFDMVTGVSALVLAFYFPRFPNYRYVRIWNWMGLGFLAIVVTIGFFSFPAPWRLNMEEPSNIWITKWPYILLPGFMVWSALTGHLILRKKLKLDPKTLTH